MYIYVWAKNKMSKVKRSQNNKLFVENIHSECFNKLTKHNIGPEKFVKISKRKKYHGKNWLCMYVSIYLYLSIYQWPI